jgi:hypothetical protein
VIQDIEIEDRRLVVISADLDRVLVGEPIRRTLVGEVRSGGEECVQRLPRLRELWFQLFQFDADLRYLGDELLLRLRS